MRFVDAKKGRTKRGAAPRRRARARASEATTSSRRRVVPRVTRSRSSLRSAWSSRRARRPARRRQWLAGVGRGGDREPARRLRLDATGRIVHVASGRPIAELARGAAISLPDVRVVDDGALGAGALRRLPSTRPRLRA